jgi:hypothetical protein
MLNNWAKSCDPVWLLLKFNAMKLVFTVERDEETGAFTASWDDPSGGGITTQASTFGELSDAINEAVRCHFGDRPAPRVATLHFTRDPEVQLQPA